MYIRIGVPEEFVKVLPVFLVLYFSKSVIKPQTAVFYGLISGISFGVMEGVIYQLDGNFNLLKEDNISLESYGYSYLYKILLV